MEHWQKLLSQSVVKVENLPFISKSPEYRKKLKKVADVFPIRINSYFLDQIKEEKKGWTSYDTDPPHKIDGGLSLTIIFLIIFFLSMIIAGVVKLRKATSSPPDNQRPVVPQAAPYSNMFGSVAMKVLSLAHDC